MNPMMMNREPAPCILVRLACERCGPVRMALPDSPDAAAETLECPYCSAECKFDQIGLGRTTRLLPYFELEANLQQFDRHPPGSGDGYRRLTRGQMVIYCQEASILHFATVDEVWTNAASISPDGMPSISFRIAELDTGPVPHISGASDLPPWWCLPNEMRRPQNPQATNADFHPTPELQDLAPVVVIPREGHTVGHIDCGGCADARDAVIAAQRNVTPIDRPKAAKKRATKKSARSKGAPR